MGSDLDLIVIVKHSELSFERRSANLDVTKLPVPVDLFVYTQAEWEKLDQQGRFYSTMMREAIWILNHNSS